jgi:hypothetical protein
MNDLTPQPFDPPTHGVNVPLLRKVLEHVTEHPDQHDQRVWVKQTGCGTAACLAGWAVLIEGLDPDMSIACGYFGTEYLEDGRDIAVVAAELIGVDNPRTVSDDAWGDHLFCQDNNIGDLWRIASELTRGEIEIPEQFR